MTFVRFNDPLFVTTSPLEVNFPDGDSLQLESGDPVSVNKSPSGELVLGDGDPSWTVRSNRDRRLLLSSLLPITPVLRKNQHRELYLDSASPLREGEITESDLLARMRIVPERNRDLVSSVSRH